jgi:hypothetical protein
MKKKGVKMPQNRAEKPLERVNTINQVEGSQNKHTEAHRVAMLRPLGNRACCCSIGK